MVAAYFENKMTVREVDLEGKRVLIRVDFNVPLKDGKVEDDFRIRAALPTINLVIEKGGKPILISHLGRPKGKRVDDLSLKPVAGVLEKLLGRKVTFVDDCIGEQVRQLALALQPGGVLLLENTRFHPGEEANDESFAKELASLGELFVNDAFGSVHRAHASTEGVTHFLSPCVAGLLLEKEINFLGKVLSSPERPFIAVIGGAKISGKIEILRNLLEKADSLIIGGGIANTFLKARGIDVGSSLYEESSLEVAQQIMREAEGRADFLLPTDVLISDNPRQGGPCQTRRVEDGIPQGYSIVDIGPETRRTFSEKIGSGRMIFWNGPMGIFEIAEYAEGTFSIADAVAKATDGGATTVVGGGDSASAARKAGIAERISHISTGGGASLEFIEGRVLPGIAALTSKEGA